MSAPAVILEQVRKEFGGQVVVDGVDLVVKPGEVLGLIGPNGGGKSTLLLMMAGLVEPTAGSVQVGGVPSSELATTATGRVGLVTAEPGLYPLLTGRENLHYFGGLMGRSPHECDALSAPLLAALELGPHMDRRTGTWSTGMRQKLSLVRALLLSPTVLLLDEPTANLDPAAARTFYEAVRAQADRGMAVVLCTHDLAAAEALCERVVVFNRRIDALQEQPGPRQAPPRTSLLDLYQRSAHE